MFALGLIILVALALVGRCVWELLFLQEPLFQRYRNDVVWTGLSLLCTVVCVLLAAEVFPYRGNMYVMLGGAGGLCAYWLSFFWKNRLPRLVNSLLRLLMAGGMACCVYLVYLMRNDFKDEQLYITGIVILVPALQSILLLTELLFNAAWSASGKRMLWFVSVEMGIAVFLAVLGTLTTNAHTPTLLTTG